MLPIFMKTLYTLDNKGKIRDWSIEIQEDKYRVISGLVDGKRVVSSWKVAKPKNIGKSNETTGEQQAILEAESEYRDKLRGSYYEDINDIYKGNRFFETMLAETFENRIRFINLDKNDPIFSQPKLDGIRCVVKKDGMWTREGEPILGAPHIYEAIAPRFVTHPNLILDGELYNHDLRDDFEKIASAVRKQTPTEAELKLSKETIQYHVYDIPSLEELFDIRCVDYENTVAEINSPYVIAVPTSVIDGKLSKAQKLAAIKEFQKANIAAGYEGTMVRFNAFYQNCRTDDLLKLKEFIDEEFPVVRFNEGRGNWAGAAKAVVCLLPDGREFKAGVDGDKDRARELLNGPVPDFATVCYFRKTVYGIPKMGIAKDFHFGRRKD